MGEPFFNDLGHYAMALHARFGDSYGKREEVQFGEVKIGELITEFLEETEEKVQGPENWDLYSATYMINSKGFGYQGITPEEADKIIERVEKRYPKTAEAFEDWYELSMTREADLNWNLEQTA